MCVKKLATVYIGIGSNIGDRRSHIDKAIAMIGMIKKARLRRVSPIYETKPVGGPPQRDFLNGVIEIKTTLDPFKLLEELQKIEAYLGRKRKVKNGPRTIDLDILLFGKRRIQDRRLRIPHPRMHAREFVMKGLRELRKDAPA